MAIITKGKAHGKVKAKIGLDIGSHAIKIVEILAPEDGKPSLAGFGISAVKGRSKDSLSTAIKFLAEESKISAKDAVISVSGPSVIVRFISMPRMSDDDLKNAIRFEAEKFIPFNINECLISFQILKRDKSGGLEILLVAAKKDLVHERIKIVEAAGFSVSAVDVDSFAMINSFLANLPRQEGEKTVALLNFGAKLTNLSIVSNSTVSFTRDVAIGSNDFNTAIVKFLGVAPEAAEELKLSPGERLAEVSNSIKGVLSNLFDDIKLSFSYHENQSGRSIDEVYISGGGAAIIGLETHFQEVFGSSPVLWNPLQFLNIASAGIDAFALEKAKGSLAIAVGLALRG